MEGSVKIDLTHKYTYDKKKKKRGECSEMKQRWQIQIFGGKKTGNMIFINEPGFLFKCQVKILLYHVSQKTFYLEILLHIEATPIYESSRIFESHKEARQFDHCSHQINVSQDSSCLWGAQTPTRHWHHPIWESSNSLPPALSVWGRKKAKSVHIFFLVRFGFLLGKAMF